MKTGIRTSLALWCTCLLAAVAGAHELPTNRVTLVLRDDIHVSLTGYIDYTEALHQTLAPQQALPDFLLQYATMQPVDFQATVARVHAQWRAATRITLPTGETLETRNWRWPEPAQAQTALRERAMHLLTGGVGHDHATETEFHAEATSPAKAPSLSLQLPSAFGKVLVVSYKPRQMWLEPRSTPVPIPF